MPDTVNTLEKMRVLAEVGPGLLHDIRNLLAIMASCAERARKRGNAVTAETLLPLETAIFSAGELTQTFSRLLNNRSVASSYASVTQPDARLAALKPILSRVVYPAEVNYRLQVSDIIRIHTAPAEFDSVILNLVINARDAFRVGGTTNPVVRISTRTLSVRGRDDGVHRVLHVCVRDNGPGMGPRTLANATKPYFTTKGAQGTGLGLHQVKRFCEAVGGRMGIRSSLGCGTAVHLLIPCADSESEMAAMTPIRLTPGKYSAAECHVGG